MKRCLLVWIALVIALIPLRAAAGQPVQLDVATDKTRIHVGDPLQLKITAEADDSTRIIFPHKDINVAPFDLLDMKHEVLESPKPGCSRERLTLTLSVYKVGDFDIPPIEIHYELKDGTKGSVRTDTIYIRVDSLLNEDVKQPRDLKAPMTVKPSLVHFFIILAIGLGIAVLLYLLVRFLRRKKKMQKEIEPYVPPRPAHEVAMEALDALRRKQYLQKGEIKKLFVELTEIFKVYLGARYGFSAVERTTGEIRRDLRRVTIADQDRIEAIDFLELSDLVKFARFSPPDHLTVDAIDRVENFIRRTMEKTASDSISANGSERGKK